MSSFEEYNRGMISYTSRDYNTILEECKTICRNLTEKWNPEADSDPGVVILKVLASCADILGVNIDWLANEVFAPSVSQRKNAEKIFGLIGYTLGWFKSATTEVTFTNNSDSQMVIDFGFNESNFSTLNAYADITGNSRTITYNILPMTNSYNYYGSRNIRQVVTENVNIFADTDKVILDAGESCTRVAVEGELRSYAISVEQVKSNNYIIKLPSQHIDTTLVWIKAKSSQSSSGFLSTQWIQCESTADFIDPEPRFAVTYDNYSNAQITVSNYLNQLDNYDSNWLIIYWIDCSGVIGCVGQDVLTNLLLAKEQSLNTEDGSLTISNLSNTVELPNTFTVTGASPETAKEAYFNSRKYIGTFDSIITLPDYTNFLNREPGVDCGVVIDCQKAAEINLAIYNDDNLTSSQKSKMYITNNDFPSGDYNIDWALAFNLGFDPNNPNKYVFSTNFKSYTAMCFAIHNDFKNSSYGNATTNKANIINDSKFIRYKPPQLFVDNVINDYRPLKSLAVDIQFGYARVFNFYVVGLIYTKKPISRSVGNNIIALVKEALALYFAPVNRNFGVKPKLMEIVDVIEATDDRIKYFDGGTSNSDAIVYTNCDPECFNYISFARYVDNVSSTTNIKIAPECLVD